MSSHKLAHSLCSSCVWGEDGYYKVICYHCPYCPYAKKCKPCYMTRETAEYFGLVARKGGDEL